jgi:peptidoglycan/xylan/chitin deacetylase (PgdA/CDA1 family)
MKKRPLYLVIFIAIISLFLFFIQGLPKLIDIGRQLKQKFQKPTFESVSEPPLSSPTPTPTPKPLTFSEMNALYGPCVYLPVLMYHHVQSSDAAKANNQVALTVTTDVFRAQMQKLKEKGYSSVSPADLAAFFDSGATFAKKSILITFDDGYGDFSQNALPILREFGFKALVFLPTGLVGNPGYLSWGEIGGISGDTFFGNHTWSHKNVKQEEGTLRREIETADTQLFERGLNIPKVFAYPYGFSNGDSKKILSELGYSLAFTTKPGSILCKKQRFDLPRVRIGNSPISAYGL